MVLEALSGILFNFLVAKNISDTKTCEMGASFGAIYYTILELWIVVDSEKYNFHESNLFLYTIQQQSDGSMTFMFSLHLMVVTNTDRS